VVRRFEASLVRMSCNDVSTAGIRRCVTVNEMRELLCRHIVNWNGWEEKQSWPVYKVLFQHSLLKSRGSRKYVM
jgi:hypothetical protein